LQITTLPIREKIFGFTTALSFEEYLNESQYYPDLLSRRYDEIRIDAEIQNFFATYPDTLRMVVLVAEESPETVIILPILMRIAGAGPRFDLRILRENDNLGPLDDLLEEIDLDGSLGEIDLPLLLIFDEEWQLQAQWGPRPQAANGYLETWLAANPLDETVGGDDTLDPETISSRLFIRLIHEMRVWYNSTLNNVCIVEIQELLTTLSVDEDLVDEDLVDEDDEAAEEEADELSDDIAEGDERSYDEDEDILLEFKDL